MRKFLSQLYAVLLCAAMFGGTVFAVSDTDFTRRDSIALSAGTMLTSGVYENGGLRSEHVLTYQKEQSVLPMVVFGSTLYGRSTITYMESILNARGYEAVAGINGSFFEFSTGIPYGCVITEGIVRSSGNYDSVGFFADGSAIIGKPTLAFSFTYPSSAGAGMHYNKELTTVNGAVLYSRDYDSATKNAISAYNIVLRPETPTLTPNSHIKAEVIDLVSNTASCPIPAGCMVLSMATETAYQYTLHNDFMSLAIGDFITLSCSISEAWQDVVYACSGIDMLVMDGATATSFTLSAWNQKAARSAVGLRTDGSLVLYTVDLSTNSVGMTLPELAARMRELGCVTALNLDGGGSTTIDVAYPACQIGTVNTPAGGALRKCANFIFLARPIAPAGDAAVLVAYPFDAAVLSGASLQLNVKAVDAQYRAATLPPNVTLSAIGGKITEDGVFTAGMQETTAVVTMQSEGAMGTVQIRVAAEPTRFSVVDRAAAKAVTELTLTEGASIELATWAWYNGYPLITQNACYRWHAAENIGTVTADGVFTAADVLGIQKGELTCTVGNQTKTVHVTVEPNHPFSDMTGHWAEESVSFLYVSGVLTGSPGADGLLVYRPSDPMTRAEYLTALMRFFRVELSAYDDVTLPFSDADRIGTWALPAIRAAWQKGYLTGSSTADGTLNCHAADSVTRQESMTLLARTLGATSDSTALARFPDGANTAPWAQAAVSAMVELGVVSGDTDGKLNPTAMVTRAQVAKMLCSLPS